MPRTPTPAVLEALAATDGDEYGAALAEVLALAGPAADELAGRRDAFVESAVVALSFRLYRDRGASLSPWERTCLLDHFARHPAPSGCRSASSSSPSQPHQESVDSGGARA